MKYLEKTISSKLSIEQNKIFKEFSRKAKLTRSELIRKILFEYINKNSLKN